MATNRSISKATLLIAFITLYAIVFLRANIFLKHYDQPAQDTQNWARKAGISKKYELVSDSQDFKQPSTSYRNNLPTEYALKSGAAIDLTNFSSPHVMNDSDAEEDRRLVKDATISSISRYAYNFVLGDIHEQELGYKWFLYNILISVNLLRRLGSEADFWVYAQLSPTSTLDEIPEKDMKLFDALDIKVVKLEKPAYVSFSSLMLDKFRALQRTEYKRFMYLDSDVLPLVNLDYYFHLSDPDEKSVPTILQPNLNWASMNSPCDGSMIMMDPALGTWDRLANIVNHQHEEGRKIPYPHFDFEVGWGHNFTEFGDHWESITRNGSDWYFYGSHTDQGLWYYYSKYVRKSVSILIGEKLQTWTSDVDDNTALPFMLKEEIGSLSKYSPKPIINQHHCNYSSGKFGCNPLNNELVHFNSNNKPWMLRVNKTSEPNEANRIWLEEYYKLKKDRFFGADILMREKKNIIVSNDLAHRLEIGWKDNVKDILNKKKLV